MSLPIAHSKVAPRRKLLVIVASPLLIDQISRASTRILRSKGIERHIHSHRTEVETLSFQPSFFLGHGKAATWIETKSDIEFVSQLLGYKELLGQKITDKESITPSTKRSAEPIRISPLHSLTQRRLLYIFHQGNTLGYRVYCRLDHHQTVQPHRQRWLQHSSCPPWITPSHRPVNTGLAPTHHRQLLPFNQRVLSQRLQARETSLSNLLSIVRIHTTWLLWCNNQE